MTSFSVKTFKENIQATEVHWSNSFVVDATTSDQALDLAEIIANGEAATMWDNYRVFRVTARSFLGGQTRARGVDLPGERTPGAEATQLPLFNVVRIILTPASGRIFSHYMRFVLDEADVAGSVLTNTMKDLINAEFMVNYLELTPARSVNGELIVASSVQSAIQNRQISAHRRFRPGFKRGWVANP